MILNLKWQQRMFLVVRKFFYGVIGILLLLDVRLITDEEQKTKVIYIVYINMYVEHILGMSWCISYIDLNI